MRGDLQSASGVQGVVFFPPSFETAFRYGVKMVQGEKFSVWLENRTTKQQWQSADLAIADVVTEKNSIQGPTLYDYVECFLSCLEAPSDSTEFSRDLLPASLVPSSLILRLSINVRAGRSVWTPTYSITLHEVLLKQVDVVEAKLRDLEERVEALDQTKPTTTLYDSGPTAFAPTGFFLQAELRVICSAGAQLQWKLPKTPKLQLRQYSELHVLEDGVYVLHLVGQITYGSYSSSPPTCTLTLLVNGVTLATVSDTGTVNGLRALAFYHIFQAKRGDKLEFTNNGGPNTIASANLFVHLL